MPFDYKALVEVDPEVARLVQSEDLRQAQCIRMIASENYASQAVVEATASSFGNKYSEGYPHKWKNGVLSNENGRYYQGQEFTNELESLAIERALKLFAPNNTSDYYANVQPLSGSPANLAVLNAFLEDGEPFLGLSLDFGGHLTHGHKVNATAKFFKAHQFGLNSENTLDYNIVRDLALKVRPKLIICGTTSYPRALDFSKFGEIAKEVGAILVADIAHISGLVATGEHPHPFPHADVMTMTTHKILRGPRGGLIVYKKEFGPQIDRSVFPALQGGPHMNNIAGIAVALKEALEPSYREYASQVRKNAAHLGKCLIDRGFNLMTGGTDTHMIVADVTKSDASVRAKSGTVVAEDAEAAGIVFNKNAVPGDEKPWIPSGVRIGTPASTTVGMKEAEMEKIADWLTQICQSKSDPAKLAKIKTEVQALMKNFRVP